jgi:DNA repair protein RecO (recombination protein O)
MSLAKESGFILRKIPFSESSFILKVFTREHGTLTLMAKGAKRPGSRFRGLIDPALHLQFLFPAFSRSEIRTLSDLSLLRDFPGIREVPIKQGLGRIFAEVLLRHPPGGADAAQFHDLLLQAQERIESSPPERALLQTRLCAFLLDYCRISGFQPQFRECVRCGGAITGSSAVFHPEQGGPECGLHGTGENTARMKTVLFRWMDELQNGGDPGPLDRTDAWKVEDFLMQYLGRHAGGARSLKSLPVWHELFVDG